jgi:hypothetical protein
MHVLAVRSHSRNSEKDDNYESDRVYVRLFSHCSAALAMVGARSAESFATALPHSLVFLLARDQPGRRRILQGATPLAAAGPGPPARPPTTHSGPFVGTSIRQPQGPICQPLRFGHSAPRSSPRHRNYYCIFLACTETTSTGLARLGAAPRTRRRVI